MAGLLAAYDRALQRSPLLVKTLTSAALFGAGDVLSQKLEGKEVRRLRAARARSRDRGGPLDLQLVDGARPPAASEWSAAAADIDRLRLAGGASGALRRPPRRHSGAQQCTVAREPLTRLRPLLRPPAHHHAPQGLEFGRMGRMVLWGAAFAPLAHVWYGQLDKFITGKGTAAVVQKVAADQVRRRCRGALRGGGAGWGVGG